MNRVLITSFTVALLCGSLLGQSPAPTSTPAQATTTTASAGSASRIAPGSVIPVQLAKSIDAKKAKPGDEVIAKVTHDLRNNAGTVIVPKDTKILGHVTEARARSKEQKESRVTIAFDHAVLKNGEQMQMPMAIQAIVASPDRNPASTDQPSGYPGSSTSQAGGGRYGPMGGGGMAPQAPSVPQETGSEPAGSPAQQPITGNTQGVVGIPDLKLSAAPDPAQGSLVSSEKNNVKLDNGTFLLLRVN